METKALTNIEIKEKKPDYKGKVRDIYFLDDMLLLVATDKLSAFDVIFNEGIPGKGKILTQISNRWFSKLDFVPNHLIETDVAKFPEPFCNYKEELTQRSVLVKKAKRIDFECVVRGYLAGSGWKEYSKQQTVCGQKLPAGLKQADKLPHLIFTPATKADSGHDENVSIETMKNQVGSEITDKLIDISFQIFSFASEYVEKFGVLLADTKFEFGLDENENIILIDEVLTPDSSRYWPKSQYNPGSSPPSYDKQFVRDYLETLDWDKSPPPPTLPENVISETAKKYNTLKEILFKDA